MSKLIHFVLVKMTYILSTLPPLLTTTVNFYILNLGEEAFEVNKAVYVTTNIKLCCPRRMKQKQQQFFQFFTIPVFLRMPFDMTTPLGFLVYSLSQMVGTFCIIYSAVPTISFLIGCCWLLKSFAEDMQNSLLVHFHSRKSVKQNSSELKQCFCKVVRFYLDVKELS